MAHAAGIQAIPPAIPPAAQIAFRTEKRAANEGDALEYRNVLLDGRILSSAA